MALPFIFGPQPGPIELSDLDANFTALGDLTTIPCMVSGTNDLTLAGLPDTPTIGGYQNFLRLSGTATATNTGTVTAGAFGLAFLPVFLDTGAGPAALSGGEIVSGNTIELVFDDALAGGTGGFHLVSGAAPGGGGGITQLTGAVIAGPGSGSQAATLAAVPDNRLISNISGGVAAPLPNTLTALLDILGTTQGGLIVRGSSVWSQAVETAWTPLITFGGAAIGITYGTQIGRFYSIGFLNFAMFNLVLTSKGSSVGAVALSLPAAAGGGGRIGGGLIVNYSNMASLTAIPWLQIAASGSTGSLVTAGSGTVSALTDTNFSNTSALSGFVFYLTG